MTSPVISINGIGKQYQIGLRQERYRTFREAIVRAARTPLDRFKQLTGAVKDEAKFWALKDVSFDVLPGEVIGIIGRNGAGKSTLLKILSRITEPTAGEVRIRGRVGSLLEVGTGFHVELTGRENVYLNGSILGMTRREIDRKFDEIVDFSGIERFLDTPVKRYSSGMAIRLGFAVAAHLEPEVLIVDEVLAVGDIEFQKKCLGKMNEVASSGRTVLFVSHNIAAVESLCTRGILLSGGRIVEDGPTANVLQTYLLTASQSQSASIDLTNATTREPGRPPLMRRVTIRDQAGVETSSVPMGSELSIDVDFRSADALSPVLGVVVKTSLGAPIFGIDNRMISGFTFDNNIRAGTINCRLSGLPLTPGYYSLDLYLGDRQRSLDFVRDAIGFHVEAADVYGTGKLPTPNCGPVYWHGEWDYRPETDCTMATSVDRINTASLPH